MYNSLKSIAKQWKSISINEFKLIYNNFKIVKPEDMVKLSKAKIADNEILIMATKKPNNTTKPPKWFKDYMGDFNEKITNTLVDLMKEIKSTKYSVIKLDDRLTQIVKANNLVDPTKNAN